MASRQRILPLVLLALSASMIAGAPSAQADEVSSLFNVPSSKWRPTCDAVPINSRLDRHTKKAPLRLTIHYTDTPKTYKRTLTEKLCILFNFAANKIEGAKKELWGDIPYHYYISSEGQLGEARNPIYQVDSNTRYHLDGHIAIVVEGNPNDGITGGQKNKLFALIRALQRKYNIPSSRIATHKDFAKTDCPGPSVLAAVREYKVQGNKSCKNVRCAAKPRCESWQDLANKAKPEACCAIWKCEAKPKKQIPKEEEEDYYDEESDYEERLGHRRRRWNPFHIH